MTPDEEMWACVITAAVLWCLAVAHFFLLFAMFGPGQPKEPKE